MNGQINLRKLWHWRIVRILESISRTVWLGLVVVIIAIILSIVLLRSMSQTTLSLEQEIKELRRGKAEGGTSATLLPILPDRKASVDFPAFLHEVSSRHAVNIDRMEYQLVREADKPLLLYRVDLVGIAPYLNVRQWLDTVLKERPSVAIDELVLERPNSDVDEITARIRLTLFMKGES